MIHQDIFGILTIHTLISLLEILLFLCSVLSIKFPQGNFPLHQLQKRTRVACFTTIWTQSVLKCLNVCYIFETLFSIVTTIIAVYFNISKRLFWSKRFPTE